MLCALSEKLRPASLIENTEEALIGPDSCVCDVHAEGMEPPARADS